MGLNHESLGKLTPGEFKELVEGLRLREKQEMKKLAWAVSNLMNATGNMKQAVTPEKLLGEQEKSIAEREYTPEDVERLRRKFEV